MTRDKRNRTGDYLVNVLHTFRPSESEYAKAVRAARRRGNLLHKRYNPETGPFRAGRKDAEG